MLASLNLYRLQWTDDFSLSTRCSNNEKQIYILKPIWITVIDLCLIYVYQCLVFLFLSVHCFLYMTSKKNASWLYVIQHFFDYLAFASQDIWESYKLLLYGLCSSVGGASDWWSGGCGFDPRRVGNIISWKLIMKYFLQSVSIFRWFKKGSCQFLAKECAPYWLTA